MPVLTTVAERVHLTGTQTLGPVAVPTGARQVRVRLSRVDWPVSSDAERDIVRVSVEVSLNTGQTWRFLGGFTAEGGPVTLPNIGLVTESWGRLRLPDPSNPDRWVRARIETRERLRTALTLEVD